MGRTDCPDLKTGYERPWLAEQEQQQQQELQRERNGALLGVHGAVRSKSD
jgi:hypothetical protein